ncbi:MAG: hypothetical protein IPG12_11140 [Saprospiraceae bacterium]|nr:hypothetical protein [Saprospiraceae bacterium]
MRRNIVFIKLFLFSVLSSMSAEKINQREISTTISIGKNGPEAIVEIDRVFDPEGRQYFMSFGYSKDSLIKTKKLDCNNIGKTMLKCYYNNSGNRDSTYLLVILQDNKGFCNQKQNTDTFSIFGSIKTQNGRTVEAEVELVKIDISQKRSKTLSSDSGFMFNNMEQEFYGLQVKNTNTDFSRGASGADIVRIQRHILSIDRFVSPYQYLAADVNWDKKINSEDIKLLREIILGRISRWPNFLSAWIFIPKDWKFTNNTVPWNSMPDVWQNIALQGSIQKDYIAIKRGDVNDSNQGNLWDDELQLRGSYFEELGVEEEVIRNDLLIKEMEKRTILINLIEINSIKSSVFGTKTITVKK